MKRRHFALAFAAAAVLGARTGLGADGKSSELIAFQRGSWDALRARHAGRRTIVHFWGLTCGPCLEEMPTWGKFRQTLKDVDLVLVAADPLPQPPDWATALLAKSGLAEVENWQFRERFTEHLYWEVDHSWQGELPFNVLLEADGAMSSNLGEADFEELARWAR